MNSILANVSRHFSELLMGMLEVSYAEVLGPVSELSPTSSLMAHRAVESAAGSMKGWSSHAIAHLVVMKVKGACSTTTATPSHLMNVDNDATTADVGDGHSLEDKHVVTQQATLRAWLLPSLTALPGDVVCIMDTNIANNVNVTQPP
jgi:hypothetical protein